MTTPASRLVAAVAAAALLAGLLAGCAEDSPPPASGFDYVSIKPPVVEGLAVDRPAGPIAVDAALPDGSARPDDVAEAQLFPGTGQFVQPPTASGAARGSLLEGAEGEITLNFAETDIREVVRTVLGETLGLNYTIDPSVTGAVTLRTNRPIPRDALLPTLETLLNEKGLALAEQNGLYRVLPAGAEGGAGIGNHVALAPGLRTGYGTEIFPLVHATAAEMQKIIQPLLGSQVQIGIDEIRNFLVVTGSSQQRQAVEEVLGMFDTDWMEGMSFALLPVTSADPATIIQELEAIYGLDQGGPLAGQIRFVPIERLGVVLTIARRPQDLEQVRGWVERLDRGLAENGRRLYVYYAQHTRVEEIVPILQDIFQQNARPGAASAGARSTAGDLAEGLEPVRIESAADFAMDGLPGSEETGGEDDEPEVSLAAASRPGTDPGGVTERDIQITADEVNNAIFVLATPRDYRLIEAAIGSLDLVPLQVLIEATIVEVTLNDDLRYGVQWFFEAGDSSFTFSTSETGTPAEAFPGFSYLLNAANARVVLNALASVTDINVLSSPQLMVLDNRSATLQVGDEVPIATQSVVEADDSDATIVNEIEFRDTGVILTVTPRVNAGGTVNMDIEQEVSDVVPTTTSGIDSPTIRQRRIASTVAIQSGQTIALGGLIRDSVTTTESGVPILSDIPMLGNLFKTTSNEKDRTELLVLITPVVIRDDREALALTDQLRKRLQAIAPFADEVP